MANRKQIKKCECGKQFESTQWNQIYCGSKTKKTGCSYKKHLERIAKKQKEYLKDPKYRKKQTNYISEWQKKQRANNTEYAQRQRKLKREAGRSEHGKEVSRLWRKNNIKKVLGYNRRRQMKKKGVIGTHTEKEWTQLKKSTGNKCLKCGETEKTLNKKWEHTNFPGLTKDHIDPISRGGTDYIKNIQPLCISCNARKKDNKLKMVVVSGYWNPLHVGHLEMIEEASKLGDRLIVIVNNDEQVKLKGSKPFMTEDDRVAIVSALRDVDGTFLSIDEDLSVCESLIALNPDVFANGGDRHQDEVPESEVCEELGIEMVDGLGKKIRASSELISNYKNNE